MSVTTTHNPVTYTAHPVLADYELHHSQADEPAPEPNTQQRPALENPPHWRDDYRRVPPYRPVNTELDQGERRVYNNGAERAFITVMFTGVSLNATMSRIWHATGGRINDKIFHYKIGGEW